MNMGNYNNPRKKAFSLGKWFCIAIAAVLACYYGYYMYMQSTLKFQPPVGFSIEINSKDMKAVGEKWLQEYVKQYQRKYVRRNQSVTEYHIDNAEIKENNVLQIDFSIVTKKLDSGTSANWNGVLEKDKVQCQWVLWFEEKQGKDDLITYKVTKLQRPAGYDLEKYQTSGQKEKDEYDQKYKKEIPFEKQQYTYKIEKGICSVSYDKGSTWKKVPVDLNTLVEVGDGRIYYNKLQDGSYVISPEKTAFVYGGTRENSLKVTYSEDKGNTWKTSEITTKLDSARLRFLSFPTAKTGYVVVTGGRAMSQEGQVIYKTVEGGAVWQEIGSGPRTSLLYSAGFVDENVGFMSYPKIQGAETNFYRSEDGGKTFKPIMLPAVKEQYMGNTVEPFIQPETPYVENGVLYVLVGQGEQGDYKGGTVMAKYKSEDKGKTWTFVELIEPPSKEIG